MILRISISALILLMAAKIAIAQPYQQDEHTDEVIQFNTINVQSNTMHYAYAGDITKPGIVFVHGTPGGWTAFERYLANKNLGESFFMLSVDRLGWGQSILSDAPLSGSFTRQANAITAVMNHYPGKKWIIVGHSLGASLAPQIALHAPDKVSGMLLLAGSLGPKLGRPRWYNWAASTWLVSRLIGQSMRNSNREIMNLRRELGVMNELISKQKIGAHVVVMQGMDDNLVSPKNSSYAAANWVEHYQSLEIIELSDAGHFLPWRQTPIVIQSLYDLAKKAF